MNLAEHLRALGLRRGDFLAVFGDIEGGGEEAAERLVEELIEAVGPEGHIVVPTFTFGAPFHPETTTAATGLLAECFRRRPGVLRTRHPTHSIAVRGPNARALVANQDLYLPFRIETPLGQVVVRGGKALLFGCDHRRNALIHVARFSVERPRPVFWVNVDIILEFGGRRRKRHLQPPCSGAYPALGRELEERGIVRPLETPWGRALWMDARELFDYVAAIERDDPERLLCADPECRWCRTMRYLLG